MKNIICVLFLLFPFCIILGQTKHKLSVEINYGLNGNFFVRSYDERVPPPGIAFDKKKFLGTIGGLDIKYNFNSLSNIYLGYAQSINRREINYSASVNGSIRAFKISHTNYFYQLGYQQSVSKL